MGKRIYFFLTLSYYKLHTISSIYDEETSKIIEFFKKSLFNIDEKESHTISLSVFEEIKDGTKSGHKSIYVIEN